MLFRSSSPMGCLIRENCWDLIEVQDQVKLTAMGKLVTNQGHTYRYPQCSVWPLHQSPRCIMETDRAFPPLLGTLLLLVKNQSQYRLPRLSMLCKFLALLLPSLKLRGKFMMSFKKKLFFFSQSCSKAT